MGCLSGDVRPIVCNGHTSVFEKDSWTTFFRKCAIQYGHEVAWNVQVARSLSANTSHRPVD
jgi:hypothetical protein